MSQDSNMSKDKVKKIKFNVKKDDDNKIEKNKIYNLDCLEYLKKLDKVSLSNLLLNSGWVRSAFNSDPNTKSLPILP